MPCDLGFLHPGRDACARREPAVPMPHGPHTDQGQADAARRQGLDPAYRSPACSPLSSLGRGRARMPLSHSVVTLSSFRSRRRRPVPEGLTIRDQARASLLLIDSTDQPPPNIGHRSAVGLLTVPAAKPDYKVNALSLQQPPSPILSPPPHPPQVREGTDEPYPYPSCCPPPREDRRSSA